MVEFDGLDIFPNNTKLATIELLKNLDRHPATIHREPLAVLTRDGYQEFLIPLTFNTGYDSNLSGKQGGIRLETPIMEKVLRPCMRKIVDGLEQNEKKYGIEMDFLKDMIHKNVNVYAEYFPKTETMEERVSVYGISETDDMPWGYRILFNTSRKSMDSLFRNFTNETKEPVDKVRNLIIKPAHINGKPIYHTGMTPSGFQINFTYNNSSLDDSVKKADWRGYIVIDYLQMGKLMKLFNVSDTGKLNGRDINVYVVRNSNDSRGIVCGVGSYDQYIKKLNF
jgi:hypothetical protein